MAGQDFPNGLLFVDSDAKHCVLADLRWREGEFVEGAAEGIRFKLLFAIPTSQAGLEAALDAGQPDVFIKAHALAPIGFDLLGRDGAREAENVAQYVAVGVFATGAGSN